ncbi:SAF domain-containing protein [Streptomyces sp. NPDC014623]|uniref:SAF domain-containing protein n=1 Tax=Streptomyces sp. NPDC014623 TaxID=3364875 RepID=UPI0036FE0585
MSKSTTIPAPGPGTQESAQGRPAPVAAPRIVKQRRRRPGLIALSVALIAVGGLSGAVLYSASGQRTPVLVVARDVSVGTKLTKADLAEASVALDPAVKSVKASRAAGLVGQRAAVDLRAGSLLTPSQVTDKSLIGPGQQLVGVSLKPSQLPATRLSPGQKVLVVSTPNADAVATAEENGLDAKPKTVAASVVAVGAPATGTGNVVVDVAVPVKDGAALAARVATGNVAVIVDARGGS